MLVQLDAISRFLESILHPDSLHELDYELLYDCLVKDTLCQIHPSHIRERDSLYISIIIVGAGKVNEFLSAARLMSRWECIGGPYWVIQLEFIRHYVLYNLRYNGECFWKSNKLTVRTLFDNFTLRKKINEFANDIELALGYPDEVRRDYFEDLTEQFPLDMFQRWFLSWSKDKLEFLSKNSADCQRIQSAGRGSCDSNDWLTETELNTNEVSSFATTIAKTNCKTGAEISEDHSKIDRDGLNSGVDSPTDNSLTLHFIKSLWKMFSPALNPVNGTTYEDSPL